MYITRIYLLFCFVIVSHGLVLAQCDPGEQLQVVNPSFEGNPAAHVTPAPWNTCGVSPDTQPGSWGVTLPPSEGNTYVGFINGGPTWIEGASQALSGNMTAGVAYTFTIDLSNTPANQGGLVPGASILVIHGANAICQQTELLWTSPPITHNNWQTYTVTFTPTQNFSHIYFSISGNSPQMSYILLDNITPIVPNLPTLNITSHINGDSDGCAFNISGDLSLPLADSVILTGAFVGSPLHASVSGANWNQTLSFTSAGPQTVYARVFYLDPATGSQACSYDSVIINVSGPIVNFDFDNHCFNLAANFVDQTTLAGIGTLTDWDWDLGDGTTSTGQNFSHVYAAPGTYDVTLTVTDNNGCESILERQISVHPLPVASINAANACAGSGLMFNSQSTVTSGAISQTLWDVQNNGTIDYTTPAGSHVYPSDGVHNITLIAVTDSGCSDTVTQAVTVYPLPVGAFTFANACDNEEITFTSQSTVSSGTIAQTLWDVQDDGTTDYTTSSGSHVYPADGSYDVTLVAVTDNGCRDTVTQAVTVHPLVSGAFSFVNACDNEEITFTSQSTVSSGTIAQTLWDVQDDGTTDYTTSSGSHVYPADGSYDITLISVSDNGCRDTITQTVTVYPLPVSAFSFVNGCDNEAVTFSSQSTVSSGTLTQTLWDVQDDGTTDYTTSSGSHLYPADGSYDVTLIVVTDNGCRDTVTHTVSVSPLPVSAFSFVNACNHHGVTLNSQATVSSGSITQTLWDVQNDGTTDYITTSGSHVYPSDGSYDVTMIAITDNGCSDTLTQSVLVYPLPVADWSSASVCLGNQSAFNNQSHVIPLDNDVISQWEWSFGDMGTSNIQNPSHIYADENVYTVQLIVTTNYGCRDTLSNTVTVWPLPAVNFSPTDVCLESLTDFQDLSTVSNDHSANSNVQWNWDFGDPAGGAANVQNPSYAYQQDGTFNTQLTVTTNNGCVSSATIPVTVHAKPTAGFVGTNLAGCAPLCPQLNSNSVVNPTSTIVEYTWTLSNGAIYTSGSPNQTVCFGNETGGTLAYDVLLSVTTDKGCTDSHSEPNFISVYHNPVAAFYAESTDLTTTNATAKFVNQSIHADHYQWDFGDGSPSSSSVNPVHPFPGDDGGDYIVTLVASTSYGCADSAQVIIEVTEDLIFYVPNTFTPNNDGLNQTFKPVFANVYDPHDYVLYVFDRWGELVFKSQDALIGWDGTYRGKLSQQGVYAWKIEFVALNSGESKSLIGHVVLLR